MIRRVATIVFASLALSTAAHAVGPGPQAEARYRMSRGLSYTGLGMGASGPLLVAGGAVFAAAGLLNTVGGSILGDRDTAAKGTSQLSGGLLAAAGGLAFNTVGSGLLATGSVLGGSAVRLGRGQVDMTAGWVSAAGAGLHLVSRVGIVTGNPRSLLLGMTGWGVAMVAGTVQLTQNSAAWNAIGVTRTAADRRRWSLALAPTASGAALVGRF